jgi:hypothetical protein
MAEWKSIDGYDNYEISDEGRVRNSKTGRVLKPSCSRGGYEKVNLRSNGVQKSAKIHRLVAENFIPNDDYSKVVNHKDGNKINNSVTNLEWCTPSENNRHAFRHGLCYRPVNSGVPRRKTMIVETGMIFDSVSDCARFLKVAESQVSMCLSGRVKTCRGYHIIYADRGGCVQE